MNIVLLKKIRSCEKRLEDFCSKSLAAVHVPYSPTPSPKSGLLLAGSVKTAVEIIL